MWCEENEDNKQYCVEFESNWQNDCAPVEDADLVEPIPEEEVVIDETGEGDDQVPVVIPVDDPDAVIQVFEALILVFIQLLTLEDDLVPEDNPFSESY